MRPLAQGFVVQQNGVEFWKIPGKSYKVAAVWDCIRPRKEKMEWYRLIWSSFVVPKHAVIAWMTI